MLPQQGNRGTVLAIVYAVMQFCGWLVLELKAPPDDPMAWARYTALGTALAATLGFSAWRARGEYTRDARVAEAKNGSEQPSAPADGGEG